MRHSLLAAVVVVLSLVITFPDRATASQPAISPETQTSIDIAEAFYTDVLIYRNLNNFGRYIGGTYIQHAPAYSDGPGELMAAVAKELTMSPDVKVRLYRTIAEKDYVAIHSVWDTGDAKYVYVDIWRVENGLLVEHWDHSQTEPKASKNSNSMYHGPDADIYSSQDVEQNRERAVALISVFDNPADTSVVDGYVSDEYIQHNPTLADGKAPLLGLLKTLDEDGVRSKTTIVKSIAMGDMVLVHSKVVDLTKANDLGTGYIDIFRFDDSGLIAEHWDVVEPVGKTSQNNNGIFSYPSK